MSKKKEVSLFTLTDEFGKTHGKNLTIEQVRAKIQEVCIAIVNKEMPKVASLKELVADSREYAEEYFGNTGDMSKGIETEFYTGDVICLPSFNIFEQVKGEVVPPADPTVKWTPFKAK